ncbi:UPF0481 protein At3g47200-like [Cucurbita maxima]|uniref:UPF0481 protein At3g47200-like n=1 Tax=Cucurbita maxima TaxID=3661 RepID=A0A6J1IHF5_CUCMA|nr:UPF0481 protein At3g47200-like [Cucurbita maxima]
MCKSGFHGSEKDQCCYLKKYTDSYVFLLLYVDDILIAGSSMREINHLKYIEKALSKFKMNDTKPKTTPLANHIKLSKGQSPKTVEEREHMASVPYAFAVGSLMYAMVHPVLHFVMEMTNGNDKVVLQGFVDADLSEDVDSSKSTSGYIYTIDGTADNSKEEKSIIPPSITELQEASVTIKKAENAKCFMNVSFKNGVFEIPPILNDDYFEPMMRNLIAFEHFYVGNDNKCIQYVSLLDHLICTEKDVSVLVKAGIVINEIGGSSIEVSELFNNLCKFVTVPNCCHFNDINKALREHCSRRWNKAIATLKHNYFNTPWAIVSFVGAIFLLIFALLQTIFSGISAFLKK